MGASHIRMWKNNCKHSWGCSWISRQTGWPEAQADALYCTHFLFLNDVKCWKTGKKVLSDRLYFMCYLGLGQTGLGKGELQLIPFSTQRQWGIVWDFVYPAVTRMSENSIHVSSRCQCSKGCLGMELDTIVHFYVEIFAYNLKHEYFPLCFHNYLFQCILCLGINFLFCFGCVFFIF